QLAESTPAMFVVFDILADGKRSLLSEPFERRRELLEAMKIAPFVLIEHTLDRDHASEWLNTREGVIAKRLDAPYRPGERVGMLKIRRERTLDCVVIGWREHAHGGAVGSLILGLYEPDGGIRHVGHSAGFPAKRGRALTMKRYPNGVNEQFFYQKEAPKHRPDWVKTVPIWSEGNGRDVNYTVVSSLPALLWAANLADLELHTSIARARNPRRPTALVFDLDPGPPATIVECCEVALMIRDRLDRDGLRCFPKTSGSKGLQLYAPLN